MAHIELHETERERLQSGNAGVELKHLTTDRKLIYERRRKMEPYQPDLLKMRRLLIGFVLLVILLEGRLPAQETPTTPATSQLARDLTGVWVLAGRPGDFKEDPQIEGGQLKFIVAGQWCITQSDADGKVIYHHGGTYTINDDEYVEKVEYANTNTNSMIDRTSRFKMKVEGDYYTQTGIDNTYTQVWKRVGVPSLSDIAFPDTLVYAGVGNGGRGTRGIGGRAAFDSAGRYRSLRGPDRQAQCSKRQAEGRHAEVAD